jgi:hypothetical protein
MNYSTIKSTLELIKKQINLDLVLSENFNGKNYFNIDLKERVSESEEYDKLLKFSNQYKLIKVEANGFKRLAIFPII